MLEENLTGGTVMGLMRRAEWGVPCWEAEGHNWLSLPNKRILQL